jgi:hypothetical protein
MVGAAMSFVTDNVSPLTGILFMMGLHPTLSGLVKYSVTPQHLKSEKLVGGNA